MNLPTTGHDRLSGSPDFIMQQCGSQQRCRILSGRSLWLTAVLALWILGWAGACAIKSGDRSAKLWHSMGQKAAAYGFVPMTLNAPPFHLAAMLKNGGGADLVVYLEGDGKVLSANGRPATDPSPAKAQGYELALADPAPTVLYLARIGQFQPWQTGKAFQPYWTQKRLSPESVEAASQALDQIMAKTGAQRIHLIGYSGGGGLALLLAEQRKDIASLVTVAGLLDTDWWVQQHGYAPLTGSINPAEQAQRLVLLPQLHFYGEKDTRVTPAMSAHFSQLAPFRDFRRMGVATDHWERWTEFWPQCLRAYVLPLRERAAREGSQAHETRLPFAD